MMDAFEDEMDEDDGITTLDVPHLLDTPPPSINVEDDYIPPAPTSAELEEKGGVPPSQPTKRPKYDKLGRLTNMEDAVPVLPSASALASSAATFDSGEERLQRPRGRPPKGKVWHDKRGWIDEGLGTGPRRNE